VNQMIVYNVHNACVVAPQIRVISLELWRFINYIAYLRTYLNKDPFLKSCIPGTLDADRNSDRYQKPHLSKSLSKLIPFLTF